jgi:transcriptional regulator with XRE-family HTH domain
MAWGPDPQDAWVLPAVGGLVGQVGHVGHVAHARSLLVSLLGTSVRSARVARGWSLADLARRAGCSRSYLSQIENGVNAGAIDATLLGTLEGQLGFATGELALMQVMASMPRAALARLQQESGERRVTSDGQEKTRERQSELRERLQREGVDALYRSGDLARLAGADDVDRQVPRRARAAGALASVPIVERVAAGGICAFGEGELHGPKVAVPAWVEPGAEGPVNGAAMAFACIVTGDSMSPTYSEGDLVVFTGAREAREGEDCYVRFAGGLGEATFKRVRFEAGSEGERCVQLIPLNARYEAKVYPSEAIEAIYPAAWVVRKVGER